MGVSKNGGTPKSSILIGFSIIFTIHFGVPLFLETPIYRYILYFSMLSRKSAGRRSGLLVVGFWTIRKVYWMVVIPGSGPRHLDIAQLEKWWAGEWFGFAGIFFYQLTIWWRSTMDFVLSILLAALRASLGGGGAQCCWLQGPLVTIKVGVCGLWTGVCPRACCGGVGL